MIEASTNPIEYVQIQNLTVGDTFVGKDGHPIWIAQSDAQKTSMGEWALRVQFVSDGGIDTRCWSEQSGELRLAVRRA